MAVRTSRLAIYRVNDTLTRAAATGPVSGTAGSGRQVGECRRTDIRRKSGKRGDRRGILLFVS